MFILLGFILAFAIILLCIMVVLLIASIVFICIGHKKNRKGFKIAGYCLLGTSALFLIPVVVGLLFDTTKTPAGFVDSIEAHFESGEDAHEYLIINETNAEYRKFRESDTYDYDNPTKYCVKEGNKSTWFNIGTVKSSFDYEILVYEYTIYVPTDKYLETEEYYQNHKKYFMKGYTLNDEEEALIDSIANHYTGDKVNSWNFNEYTSYSMSVYSEDNLVVLDEKRFILYNDDYFYYDYSDNAFYPLDIDVSKVIAKAIKY